MAALAVVRSQVKYAIRDVELTERTRTELAFEHLRRLIAVDGSFRGRWRTAFSHSRAEEECEKLGAVHLLSHGIWAFKAKGAKAETDLLFGEPVASELDRIRRTSGTLVLTEWKLARDLGEIAAKAREAREQTDRYKAGVLGSVELKHTRYIVIVTEHDAQPPGDMTVGGVDFRHVIVPVDPKSASVPVPKAN